MRRHSLGVLALKSNIVLMSEWGGQAGQAGVREKGVGREQR
jgi:hypothetical protein